MEYLLTIPCRLCSLNEFIKAERTSKYKAAKIKRENEDIIIISIRQQLRGVRIEKPVEIHYTWVEKDKRRDRDNVAFAKKFIQDALVKAGTLKDDGWDDVIGFSDRFEVDKKNPRVEVLIREV